MDGGNTEKAGAVFCETAMDGGNTEKAGAVYLPRSCNAVSSAPCMKRDSELHPAESLKIDVIVRLFNGVPSAHSGQLRFLGSDELIVPELTITAWPPTRSGISSLP